ncbi:hypothetical protein LCAUCD174_2738 [Lacticaseibacillus paracasei]|nr:hypothetical protein LCAUCD174_2738 [Lacticaseibacillus paracasei]
MLGSLRVRGGRGSKAAVLTIVDRVTRLMATTKLENLSQMLFLRDCKTDGGLSGSGSISDG